MNDRSDALLNGLLIVLGAAAVLDNVIFHWLLGWHRLIEGIGDPTMFLIELALVLLGLAVCLFGTWREYAARSG